MWFRMVAKTGTFTDRGGNERNRYVTLGRIEINLDEPGGWGFQDPNINLSSVWIAQRVANPKKTGDSIMFSLYPEDDKAERKPQPNKTDDEFNDDLPF